MTVKIEDIFGRVSFKEQDGDEELEMYLFKYDTDLELEQMFEVFKDIVIQYRKTGKKI